MSNEPAVILGLIQAVVALLVGFGLDITAEQVGLISATAAAVVAFVIRQQVSPANSTLLQRGRVEGGQSAARLRARQPSQ